MKIKANKLEFISRINEWGDGVEMLSEERKTYFQHRSLQKEYDVRRLSITEGTYIAFGMSVFVVKLNK